MGQIKKDIKQLFKSAGSKGKAINEAKKWFDKGKTKGIADTRRPFEPGKIYVFEYKKPKHIDRIAWFDANPVVLALDPTDFGNDCGINLNLLPPNIKEDLLDFVYEQMKGQIENQKKGGSADNAKKQSELKFTYEGAKRFLKEYGFDFAIRQYIPNLKTNQKVVSYESWAKIAILDFADINGSDLNKIQEAFRNHLKK